MSNYGNNSNIYKYNVSSSEGNPSKNVISYNKYFFEGLM